MFEVVKALLLACRSANLLLQKKVALSQREGGGGEGGFLQSPFLYFVTVAVTPLETERIRLSRIK